MKSSLRCPACKKSFKTPQARGSHVHFCQRMNQKRDIPHQERPEPETTPVPERRELWDVNWTSAQKEAAILRGMELTWGIGRRGGRWVPIPVLGGMDYDSAVEAADRRNVVSRIRPVLPIRRLSHPQEPDTTDDDLFLAVMMLDMI